MSKPEGPTPSRRVLDVVTRALDEDLDSVVKAIVARIRAEVDTYIGSDPGVSEDDVTSNVRQHVEAFRQGLADPLSDGAPLDLSFVLESARHRAEHGLTGENVVRTFSSGSTEVWAWLVERDWEAEGVAQVDVLNDAWPIWQAYVTRAQADVGVVYREIEMERLAAGAEARTALVQGLIERTVRPNDAGRLLARVGLSPSAPLSLAVMESPDQHDASFDQARGLLRTVMRRLETVTGSTPLLHLRDRRVVLLCQTPAGGSATLRRELEEALRVGRGPSLGLAALISDGTLDLARLPDTFALCDRALDAISGQDRIVLLTEVRIVDLAAHALGRDVALVCPPAMRAFIKSLDQHPEWAETTTRWMEASMNVKVAADLLHVHVNTMYYRIEQIERITGLDLRQFDTLSDLALALRLREELGD